VAVSRIDGRSRLNAVSAKSASRRLSWQIHVMLNQDAAVWMLVDEFKRKKRC
jgi:hypothetical protein